jgi:CBS domain-containing protein
MLKIAEIMSRNVVTVSPDVSIRDAMELLVDRHMSGVPVVSRGKLVGVITTTDLLDFVIHLPGMPAMDREGSDAQESEVDAVSYNESEGANVNSFDDALLEDTSRYARASEPHWNAIEESTVSEVMTAAPVRSLQSHTSVTAAADYMNKHGIHRVFVVDDGDLKGIVTSTDITRAVANGKLTTRSFIFASARPFEVDDLIRG